MGMAVYRIEFSGRVKVKGTSYIEASSPDEAEEQFFGMIDDGTDPSDDIDYSGLDSDWVDIDRLERV